MTSPSPDLGARVVPDIGIYCLVRAILVAVAVVLGYWISIVVLIVFLPDPGRGIVGARQATRRFPTRH